jgi:hypothetical protein
MNGAAFEAVYRGKLWRISVSEFQGQQRLSIWAHYQDHQTGEWRPCGGKKDAPGFIVPIDRHPELEAAIVAIGVQLRSASG